MRHAPVGPVYFHALGVTKETGDEPRREFKYLLSSAGLQKDTLQFMINYSKYAMSIPGAGAGSNEGAVFPVKPKTVLFVA